MTAKTPRSGPRLKILGWCCVDRKELSDVIWDGRHVAEWAHRRFHIKAREDKHRITRVYVDAPTRRVRVPAPKTRPKKGKP